MDSEIVSLLRKRREGLSFQNIARELHLSPREKQKLRKSLKRLEGQGIILRLKRKYYVPAKMNLIRGRFTLTRRGFGFVTPENRISEDIFIPSRFTAGARRGDIVEVLYREKGKKGKPEGRVVKIVKAEKKTLLGFVSERWGSLFFLPLDSPSTEEIPLSGERPSSLRPGMIVEIDRKTRCLIEILGMPDEPGVDTRVIIKMFSLASLFSKEALAEAKELSAGINTQEKKERRDFRKWTSVTIDGGNAQDFDDAVSVKRLKNGHFLLGVHIADVSHYVKPGSSLDAEAFERGTSVYFPDRTLPMLPERLSNNICSLRPQEDKLTFSVLLEIDREGEVVKAEFSPSLIRTAERMTYDAVYRIFEGNAREKKRYSSLIPDLLLMRELASLLRRKRVEEGSLDFDLLEPELIYKEGSLHSIVPFEANEAHHLIEEFMLAANEAVARFLTQKNIALLYRVHPQPSLKDLERLKEILAHFNLTLPLPRKISSKDLQRVLEDMEGKMEEKFVSLQVLKSMKLAVYSEENAGHYGLAKKEYTHFTSPIRRYPDLLVHRILKKVLRNEREKIASLSSLALHCSEQERAAEEAERELLEWRIFRFLKGKLGEEFDGIIVDITSAGLIVELDDYFVDGLVSYSDLGGDYFRKRSEKTLVGRRTGRTFELGDRMKVTLASVDPILRRMSLVLSQKTRERSR
jgi:ribonuclease R